MTPRALPLLAALSATACGDPVSDVLALHGEPGAGAAVYSDNCISCHAVDGSGGSGPSLIDGIPRHSDEQIVGLVLDGVGDEMPSFAGSLEDQDIADLLAWLRDTFGDYDGDGR